MNVGRVVRLTKDNDRNEIFSGASDKRNIIMSIFYPADEAYCADKKALYKDLYEPAANQFIQEWADGDEDTEKYLNQLSTNAYINAPIKKSNDKYPVVIYSPGYSCDRDLNVFTLEKLVEQGYVVITLGSLYETDFTVMPDGKIIRMAPEFEDLSNDSKVWNDLIDIRKKDIIFLLSYLDYINENDEMVKNRLLTDKIGLVGFSMGSQACFEAAADDKRIKAVVLLEGCLHNTTVCERVKEGQKSDTPFLLFKRHASSQALRLEECNSWHVDDKDDSSLKNDIKQACRITETQKALYEFLDGYKSFVKIEHTNHITFSDMPVLFDQDYASCLGGKISINTVNEIISTATTKFFDEFLNNRKNEYTDFIKHENRYTDLKEINGDGDIINK